ncbi:MAG: helix-turn-helix domain-containing protein [Christensenellales bacterium]|jgi:excisionase family DNA binding protein
MEPSKNELYRAVFKEYPDVLDVKQVSKLLNVSTKTVYRLIGDGALSSFKVGREFHIPKVAVMRYVKVFGSPVCEAAI